MYTQLEIIDPARAQEILQKNPKNRKLNQWEVRRIADQLRQGLWKPTHQGIAISDNGNLIDGQHRLAAIVESGVAAEMLVTTGLDDDCIEVVDVGRKRSPADAFMIHGVPDPSLVSSGIRLYHLYHEHSDKVWSGQIGSDISSKQLLNLYYDGVDEEHAELARRLANRSYSAFRHLRKSVVFAFVLIALDVGQSAEQINRFLEKLSGGLDLKSGSPIAQYRRQVMNGYKGSNSMRKGGVSRQILMVHLIQLFNYDFEDVTLQLFKEQGYPPMPRILKPSKEEATA